MHLLAQRTGLTAAIDESLQLLQVHQPYHESDHVLNVAYNILAGGTVLDDITLQREDEAYLDALGAERIPAPTTEGDFARRFEEGDVVRIISGPFADFNGTISEINVDQSKLKVLVNIFDRETPVELGFDQVAKV